MAAEFALVIVFVVATVVPIILMVVVRRRQKHGEWSGGFTPGYRKWTLGEEDEWRNVRRPATTSAAATTSLRLRASTRPVGEDDASVGPYI